MNYKLIAIFALSCSLLALAGGCCDCKSMAGRLDAMQRQIAGLQVDQKDLTDRLSQSGASGIGGDNKPVVKDAVSAPRLVQLNADLLGIVQKHVPRNSKGEVIAGEMRRSSFSTDELAQIDALIKEHSDSIGFDRIVVSGCGACAIPGGSKGYKLYIPSAGIYACATCGG